MPVKKSKSMDKMPARKMPEGFEFPKNKKAVPNKPTAKPKSTPMPYKPSTRKPDVEKMPYNPSSRGGTSAGPAPSEESRRPRQPSVEDRIYRTMPITEPQLKQIKNMYGIE